MIIFALMMSFSNLEQNDYLEIFSSIQFFEIVCVELVSFLPLTSGRIHQIRNLNEMDQLFERYKLPRLIQKEIDNENSSKSNKDITFIVKIFP